MASKPPCHPTVVRVMVNGMNRPRTRGIYLLCEDDPSSPRHSAIGDRRTPPDSFFPTADERDEGCESIVRSVRPQEML
jgi:hypothetical protein